MVAKMQHTATGTWMVGGHGLCGECVKSPYCIKVATVQYLNLVWKCFFRLDLNMVCAVCLPTLHLYSQCQWNVS